MAVEFWAVVCAERIAAQGRESFARRFLRVVDGLLVDSVRLEDEMIHRHLIRCRHDEEAQTVMRLLREMGYTIVIDEVV